MDTVCEQLEVNGIDTDNLTVLDGERLRSIFADDDRVQWKLFEAVAIAAETLVRTRPAKRTIREVSHRALLGTMILAGLRDS
jgi:hypothetical protein